MLKSFEIRGFRTFQELKIESLGQVNLIVGKNNVGKTTLLEALRLYASNASSTEIDSILRSRGERPTSRQTAPGDIDFGSLFFGRSPGPREGNRISLGEIDEPGNRLDIRLILLERIEEPEPKGRIRYEELGLDRDIRDVETEPGFEITLANASFIIPLSRFERGWELGFPRNKSNSIYIPAHGIPDAQLVRWWDSISLFEAEDRVYECLRLIAPVRAIKTIQESARSPRRVFRVRVDNVRAPMPLAALGHGASRMMQIVVAAEQLMQVATPQQPTLFPELSAPTDSPFLLVDEIENGIYYEVLPDLWRFVFRLAKLNNLQVFVTTHSADCVKAFLQVSKEDEAVDGRLIRLEGRDEKRRARQFDESEFPTILEYELEVR